MRLYYNISLERIPSNISIHSGYYLLYMLATTLGIGSCTQFLFIMCIFVCPRSYIKEKMRGSSNQTKNQWDSTDGQNSIWWLKGSLTLLLLSTSTLSVKVKPYSVQAKRIKGTIWDTNTNRIQCNLFQPIYKYELEKIQYPNYWDFGHYLTLSASVLYVLDWSKNDLTHYCSYISSLSLVRQKSLVHSSFDYW